MVDTIEQVKELGTKHEMTYNDALNLCFYQEILERMSCYPKKEELWLKMDGKISNRLVYYKKELFPLQIKKEMEDILKAGKNQSYELFWDLWVRDDQIEILIDIHFEKLQLPFKIIMRPLGKKEGFAGEEIYTSPFCPEKQIPYRRYPQELDLAECLYEIMDKLELLGGMEPYERIWHIISSVAVDGRHVCSNLSGLFKEFPVPSLEKRWDTVYGYRDYGYMRKRWKNHCKAQKSLLPTWEELMNLMDNFFTPIWRAVLEDEIFMGDWMPHLGRYL